MRRIVSSIALTAVFAWSGVARADDGAGVSLVPALSSPVGDHVDLFPRLALGGGFLAQDDGAHPNAFTCGLVFPGGGQFMNGDWFAGFGVAATVVLFAGAGITWLMIDPDPSTALPVGISLAGIAALIWGAAAVEAAMGGACLGNCLGTCLTACGVASMLPGGGTSRRRTMIHDGGGSCRSPSPAPQRPTPYQPSPSRPIPQ